MFDKIKRFVPGKGARAHKAQLLPNTGRGLGYSNHVLFTQCCHANHTIDHYHDFQCCLAFSSICLLAGSKRAQPCCGGGGREVEERWARGRDTQRGAYDSSGSSAERDLRHSSGSSAERDLRHSSGSSAVGDLRHSSGSSADGTYDTSLVWVLNSEEPTIQLWVFSRRDLRYSSGSSAGGGPTIQLWVLNSGGPTIQLWVLNSGH